MGAWPTAHPYDPLARKWSELVNRRRDHFIELYKTGRWKHYYTEPEILAQLQDVIRAAEDWEKLAGKPKIHQAG